MKKNIYYILSLFVLLAFSSCEEDPLVYEGDNFVALDLAGTSLISLDEGGDSHTVTVLMAFARPTDTKVTLGFSEESNAVEDVQFSLDTKEVIIKAGEHSATFVVTPLDNDKDYLIEQKVEVKLVSVDAPDVNVALANGTDGMITFALRDNDIPPNPLLDPFVGTYTANGTSYFNGPLVQTVQVYRSEENLEELIVVGMFGIGDVSVATTTQGDGGVLELHIQLGQEIYNDGENIINLRGFDGASIFTEGDLVSYLNEEGNVEWSGLTYGAYFTGGPNTDFYYDLYTEMIWVKN